jgi:hypothetical protein
VIKVAGDFIGLLVLGVYNASIAADAVRPEFKCKPGVSGRAGLRAHSWLHQADGQAWGKRQVWVRRA